jgi:hypothetical protein
LNRGGGGRTAPELGAAVSTSPHIFFATTTNVVAAPAMSAIDDPAVVWKELGGGPSVNVGVATCNKQQLGVEVEARKGLVYVKCCNGNGGGRWPESTVL